MAVLAGTVYDRSSHAAGLVSAVMLFLFNFFFGVGFLGIFWLCKFFLSRFLLCHVNANSACGVFASVHPHASGRPSDGDQL